MNRREFLATGAGAAAAVLAGSAGAADDRPAFARGAVELKPVLTDIAIESNPALFGRAASYFCDDAIWFLRDITRQKPKSMFDHPFLAVLKECHEKYGLKVQINLFYRTDFFYGMDEFTLVDVTDAYKGEWQDNRDWLKLGFHSLQEFPDYPWVNIDYADVKKLFGMIRGEIDRFAGDGVFTTALVPHWCPMSKDGCRAMKDCGIEIMECTVGPRYRYDGDRSRLPYGHAFKLEQNRKPESAFYWRDSRNAAISGSLCAYNHIDVATWAKTQNSFRYVLDKTTGMRFKQLFGDAPVLNLVDEKTLVADTMPLLGREHLVFSNHEQYFFKDYLAYQPDYTAKVRAMSRLMHENGYRFILIEDLARRDERRTV